MMYLFNILCRRVWQSLRDVVDVVDISTVKYIIFKGYCEWCCSSEYQKDLGSLGVFLCHTE